MKKTLVIGDVHLRYNIVEKILNKWDGPIIQVGDWFDNFDENKSQTIETALLYKKFVHRPDTITLMGNHDIQYRIHDKNGLYCSGYEPWKYDVINDIVEEKDWCKVKYFYHEQNYWFSHAGISNYWFGHPVFGTTAEIIEGKIAQAEKLWRLEYILKLHVCMRQIIIEEETLQKVESFGMIGVISKSTKELPKL